MDTNKMRAAFEAMILADGKSIRRCGDSYHFGTIHRKWLFWQEAWRQSRAAVVVELPAERRIRHMPTPDENSSYNEALENCRDAIEAQGLKVAP
ncbi:hypothetical protein [Pseudomonas guariconensis]|uniref:hypothetical protein n=1 Tax=Pseudomonas guariconensis TaxID=1288410 RepID=UPI0018D64894|nr:hypothetical protein [Pseudomonas guariconensis]MBH3360488.1 hypothetical protein [Pseudomonas guariconensis]